MDSWLMEKIDKQDIQDILMYSKRENVKYLHKVLSMKNVSVFDIAYIMATLKLSDKKIKLIEYSIAQYNKLEKIKNNESMNEYIFDIVKNIEKMENSNEELLLELMECKNEIKAFKKILNMIIEGNLSLFKIKENMFKQTYAFQTIYIDK